MSYIKRSQLKNYALNENRNQRLSKSEALAEGRIPVFLSHSHHDKELVFGVRAFFEAMGIKVYVDWLDEELPSNISPETALKLRTRINSSDRFIVLATNNSKNSKWVPWELGIADGLLERDNIAIFPVEDDWGLFHGSEYLSAYPRLIVADDGKPAVFAPGSSSGVYLLNWIKYGTSPY